MNSHSILSDRGGNRYCKKCNESLDFSRGCPYLSANELAETVKAAAEKEKAAAEKEKAAAEKEKAAAETKKASSQEKQAISSMIQPIYLPLSN